MTADTTLTPERLRTRYSAENPAPDAIRCTTPGCFRQRTAGSATCPKLRPKCRTCAGDTKPRKRKRPKPLDRVVLTRTVRVDVWPLAAAGENSTVLFTTRDVPRGSLATVLPGRAVGDGDSVIELDGCRGRFVCPADAMRPTTGGDR